MESNQPDDSKTSTEETDTSVLINYGTGTGRFYECTFCKRGFTTAQALGGHMNIHRGERSQKPHHGSSFYAQRDTSPRHVLPFSNFMPSYPPPAETLKNCQMHFPTSSGGQVRDSQVENRQQLNLFTAMPTEGEASDHTAHVKNEDRNQKEEEELDLELRLGHDA